MTRAEAIVIGGGIAGLSVAARLANEMRVVVLETEGACGYHASGRSVAFAHFGLGDRIVRTLTALSLREFRAMESVAGDPIARVHPALHIARADQRAELDALQDVHDRFECAYEILQDEDIHRAMPALTIGPERAHRAILDTGSLRLDTDAMLRRHMADLKANGGSLVTNAPVRSIASDAGLWAVETPAGAFGAPQLINAAGAWADEVARMAGVPTIGLQPRRRTVISFDGPPETDVSRWPFTKTVTDGFYLLPEGTGRLLASPMDQTPSAPCDAAAEELDKAIAADQVETATSLDIRRIAHSWAGLRTFAPDELPVIGEAPEAPGFYWVAGQGGYGFQTSAALSSIAARSILAKAWPGAALAAGITPEALSPSRFAKKP
ncbi:MAG: FAD-dependent oxidoreductase [Pseudomonadota bacterium]